MQFNNKQEALSHVVLKHLGLLRRGWFPSFQEFVPHIAPVMDVCQRIPGCGPADTTAMGQLYYNLMIIYNAGAPVFKLRPELAQMLKETDLPSDMGVEFLRLPFEGIFVDFPVGTLAPPAAKVSRMFLVHLPGERFRVVCTPDPDTTHHASLRMPDAVGEDHLETAGITIAAAVEETRRRAFENVPQDVIDDLKANALYEDYFSSDMFVFAVNAALYITSDGADIVEDKSEVQRLHGALQGLKKKSKREKLEQELRQAKDHKIYICGSSLTSQRELHALLTEEGRRLTKRFRVRGHWRNQACGTGRLERRHIFVQPFWKGPTFSELLERNYVVRK